MRAGRIAVVVAALLLGRAVAATATPEDAITPVDQYTTVKGRNLAIAHSDQLVQFYYQIYNCLPWLAVVKNGIGFRQPRGVEADDRYLSLWVSIDQKTDGPFAQLPLERRASAMFSRYGVDMLRRMTQLNGVASDANLQGFSVVLSWLKPGTDDPDKTPVMETLALFTDKTSLAAFLARQVAGPEFVKGSIFNVFEGKEQVGRVPLDVWEDNFNSTFKLPNYVPPSGAKC